MARIFWKQGWILLLVTICCLGFVKPAEAGFGVSPPTIIADKLVPGSHYEQIIYLVQGNPERDLQVNAGIDVGDATGWISFEGGGSQIIPAGVQQFPLKVLIDVPKKADLGIYRGAINISTAPKQSSADENSGGASVTMAIGAKVTFVLTVGDQVVEAMEVRSVKILNIEEGGPLSAMVRIQNIGNVPTKPGAITFDLYDKFGNVRLAFIDADMNKVENVAPFATEEVKIKFPLDLKLGLGEYWGEVKVYDKDKQLVKTEKGIFSVTKRKLWKDWRLWVAAGVMLGILGYGFIRFKRRKKKNMGR